MAKPDPWMSVDDAIKRVMQARHCSCEEARRLLIDKVKQKKIKLKREPLPPEPSPWLTPAEIKAQLRENGPESLHIPLNIFKIRSDFTDAELLGELRSGRLVASATGEALFHSELTGVAHASNFTVTFQALLNWAGHPKTPRRLLAKLERNMSMLPH